MTAPPAACPYCARATLAREWRRMIAGVAVTIGGTVTLWRHIGLRGERKGCRQSVATPDAAVVR